MLPLLPWTRAVLFVSGPRWHFGDCGLQNTAPRNPLQMETIVLYLRWCNMKKEIQIQKYSSWGGGLLKIQATRPSAKLQWLMLLHHAYTSIPLLHASFICFCLSLSIPHCRCHTHTHIYGQTLLRLCAARQKAGTHYSSLPPIRALILNISLA